MREPHPAEREFRGVLASHFPDVPLSVRERVIGEIVSELTKAQSAGEAMARRTGLKVVHTEGEA